MTETAFVPYSRFFIKYLIENIFNVFVYRFFSEKHLHNQAVCGVTLPLVFPPFSSISLLFLGSLTKVEGEKLLLEALFTLSCSNA
jgi:hypothetical protein